MTVTFTPFGVASEYSCKGWRPTGSSLSWVGPAIGRLMFANWPPLGLAQVQTFGGVYSDELLISFGSGFQSLRRPAAARGRGRRPNLLGLRLDGRPRVSAFDAASNRGGDQAGRCGSGWGPVSNSSRA